MAKRLILSLAIVLFLACQMACNSNKNNDTDDIYYAATSVEVKMFRLSNDKKVLDSLQNVFFTIDLLNGKIYNADSLPYGTNVTKLVPIITAPTSASTVELRFHNTINDTDSIVNYLETTTDSIDFTEPVQLKVISESKTVVYNYEIKVNVHAIQPDSLSWNALDPSPLPSTLSQLSAQRTAVLGGRYYCLSGSDSEWSLASCEDPASEQWTIEPMELGFVPDVASLAATTEALYLLDADGALYSSNDGCSWAATGESFSYLYGNYGAELLGAREADGARQIVSYPGGQTWEMPAGFPVRGASQPCFYDPSMAYGQQMVLVGGVDAEGQLLKSVWGYDGSQWACISQKLPVGIDAPAVVPYELFYVPSSTWRPVQFKSLLLIGGRLETGALNRVVYYSPDWGLTWRKASDLMQPGPEQPSYSGVSAFVHNSVMQVSRVVSAPTEWVCPAIYCFGGYDGAGRAQNVIWRGVVLRYTYLQPY